MVDEKQFGAADGAEEAVQDGARTCVAVMVNSGAVFALEDLDLLLRGNDSQQIAVSKHLVLFDPSFTNQT